MFFFRRRLDFGLWGCFDSQSTDQRVPGRTLGGLFNRCWRFRDLKAWHDGIGTPINDLRQRISLG